MTDFLKIFRNDSYENSSNDYLSVLSIVKEVHLFSLIRVVLTWSVGPSPLWLKSSPSIISSK